MAVITNMVHWALLALKSLVAKGEKRLMAVFAGYLGQYFAFKILALQALLPLGISSIDLPLGSQRWFVELHIRDNLRKGIPLF